jgi:hypothetical protein
MNSNPFKNNSSQYNKSKRSSRENFVSVNNFRGNAPKRPKVPEINNEQMFPELGARSSKSKSETITKLEEAIKSENYLDMANKLNPVIKITTKLKPGWVKLSWKAGKLHKYSRERKIVLSESDKKEEEKKKLHDAINRGILEMKERWYKYDEIHSLEFINYDIPLEEDDFEEEPEEYNNNYDNDLEMNEDLM